MEEKSKGLYTIKHRVLHWLTACLMLLLFVTGFLRMYWMAKSRVANAVQQNTQGMNISKSQLSGITKSIMSPMWQWHVLAAYGMALVFIARLLYMAVKGTRFPNAFQQNIDWKERLRGSVYFVFYVFVFVAVITGFYLKWIDGGLKDIMESIHKWAIYWFPVFILLHFGGIWLGELTTKKGITSKMIGGD